MATDQRRLAADARRMAPGREEAAAVRTLLKRNYDRGRVAGREEARAEVANHDSRTTLLACSADYLDAAEARASSIPNSDRTMTAFREASAILRDAARLGEPEPFVRMELKTEGETEGEAKPATKKRAAKRTKKSG
jgi:hypothetical protein